MEQHIFTLIIEGNTEKVLQFIMPLKPIHIKNVSINELKTFLNSTDWLIDTQSLKFQKIILFTFSDLLSRVLKNDDCDTCHG
jgi:hypothetical protein